VRASESKPATGLHILVRAGVAPVNGARDDPVAAAATQQIIYVAVTFKKRKKSGKIRYDDSAVWMAN
jgi:hypothetical protein